MNAVFDSQRISGSAIFDSQILGASTRYARPASVLVNTGWTASTGSDLAAMVNEATADDATYVMATLVGAKVRFGCGAVLDPATSTGQVWRMRFPANASASGTLIYRLYDSNGTTLIKTGSMAVPTTAYDWVITLSGAECDAITDYSALQIELEAA